LQQQSPPPPVRVAPRKYGTRTPEAMAARLRSAGVADEDVAALLETLEPPPPPPDES
jgi:hypothetical protein